MDSAVNTAIDTALAGFATDATALFGDILPVALGLTVSVAVVFGAIKWFRALVHI